MESVRQEVGGSVEDDASPSRVVGSLQRLRLHCFACTMSLVTRHTHCTSTVTVFKKVNNQKEKRNLQLYKAHRRG